MSCCTKSMQTVNLMIRLAQHSLLLIHSCLIIFIMLVSSVDCTLVVGQTSVHKKSMDGRLELRLTGTTNNPVLTVALRNVGNVPIKVDGELVFLLDIQIMAADGTSILLEEERIPQPSDHPEEEFKKRLVSVLPGQMISRLIDLRQGFKIFTVGLGGVSPSHNIVTAYEVIGRLPIGKIPKKVIVRYHVRHGFREGFQKYTGLESTDLNLYEGPLTEIIEFE